MFRPNVLFVPLGVALALDLTPPRLSALPQFTAEYKQSCQLCHQNPTGGGMRTLYGAQFFSYMELPVKSLEDFTKLEDIQPKLSKNIQIGADFRSMFFTMTRDTNAATFFTMEDNLYLAFMPTERATLYLGSLSYQQEVFLLLQGLPMSGALRVGQFVPAYGWRFEDHKSFVRDMLGFSPQSHNRIAPDNGVEFGFYPMEWEASLALTNGAGVTMFDSNDDKTITTRAIGRFSVSSLNLTAGGSYRYAELGRARPALRYFGPFIGANWSGFTYLGETDWMVSGSSALVASHLVSYRIQRGINVSTQYDFYDPDLDVKSGSSTRWRLSSELYLTGYLELIPAYEINEDKTPIATRRYGTGELQLHFWF